MMGEIANESFMPGEKVAIFGITATGRPFLEGYAHIIDSLPFASDLYLVQFEGERRVVERVAFRGEWQADPRGMLAKLRRLWRNAVDP